MKKAIDISGQQFGQLTAIIPNGFSEKGEVKWACMCSCGNTVTVVGSRLRAGKSKSCGCYKGRYVAEKNPNINGATFNGSATSEYTSWRRMKSRCTNPNHQHYKDYGGRGITVCDRWINSFANFLSDMGRKPVGIRLSIERDDVNGNYEPANCRWATDKEQQRNTRANTWIEYNGERKLTMDWAETLDISVALLRYHLKAGKTFEEIYERFSKSRPYQYAQKKPRLIQGF